MATRNLRISRVIKGRLYDADGDLICAIATITRTRTGWFDWLGGPGHKSFHFSGESGSFTAVKEPRRGRSGKIHYYWVGHRRIAGRLRKAYLGKAHKVTLAALEAAAARLAQLSLPDPPPDPPAPPAAPAGPGEQAGEGEQLRLGLGVRGGKSHYNYE